MTAAMHDSATENATTDVVALAVEGLSTTEIGRLVGLHRTTVYRALRTPENAARLAEARAALREGARVRIDGMTETALDTVAALMIDDEAPHAVRLRAAEMILDRAGVDARVVEAPEANGAAAEEDDLDALLARYVEAKCRTVRGTDEEIAIVRKLLGLKQGDDR